MKCLVALLCAVLVVSTTLADDKSPCFCNLQGVLDDCPCTAQTLDVFNSQQIHKPLMELLKTYYFRYFQVAFKKPCTFYSDDGGGMCASRTCAVETCGENEVPESVKCTDKIIENEEEEEACDEESYVQYLARKFFEIFPWTRSYGDAIKELFHYYISSVFEVKQSDKQEVDDNANCEENVHPVHHKVDEHIENEDHRKKLNEFCTLDPLDDSSEECEFVDLMRNPEKFTGYKGKSAWRIWNTIYTQLCFKPDSDNKTSGQLSSATIKDMCFEKRAFYRIVSGLHSSISIHICNNYLLQEENFLRGLPAVWGPNVEEFQRRFSPESTESEGPERLKNAYFLYLLELRAIAKAAPVLENIEFSEGNEKENEEIKKILSQVLESAKNFPEHFREEQLFNDENMDNEELLNHFKEKFYKISLIMDCMGCDRCRVWGKLQVTGIGVALKILFNPLNQLQLSQHEVVALFNAFGRISSSLEHLELFRTALS